MSSGITSAASRSGASSRGMSEVVGGNILPLYQTDAGDVAAVVHRGSNALRRCDFQVLQELDSLFKAALPGLSSLANMDFAFPIRNLLDKGEPMNC